MISGSPAWKPQATLTELASSIMAASLPISHAPKPSPRSQLRSIVFMGCSPSLVVLSFTAPPQPPPAPRRPHPQQNPPPLQPLGLPFFGRPGAGGGRGRGGGG